MPLHDYFLMEHTSHTFWHALTFVIVLMYFLLYTYHCSLLIINRTWNTKFVLTLVLSSSSIHFKVCRFECHKNNKEAKIGGIKQMKCVMLRFILDSDRQSTCTTLLKFVDSFWSVITRSIIFYFFNKCYLGLDIVIE